MRAGPRSASIALCWLSLLSAATVVAEPAQSPPAPTAPTGAVAPSAPTAPTGAVAPSAPTEPAVGSCVENLPDGKPRPKVEERLPGKSVSGHLLGFEITVHHGKGETVLPAGLKLERNAEAAKEIEAAGFLLPDEAASLRPTQKSETRGQGVVTTVTVPFIPLPEKPGRQELVLPPLPVSVARASGEVVTVCTQPHRVTVEEPIANTPNPKPRGNSRPERQLEVWHAAQRAALGGLLALLAAAAAALLWRWWRRRPRRLPPPPPPRPPWEVALEELFDIRNAGLVKDGRLAEHFDRVSDAVRKYLGARFGYDGLESTTREALHCLREVEPPLVMLEDVERFLRDADLVKFARQTPTEAQCSEALTQAEAIVVATRPPPGEPRPAEPAPSSGGPAPSSDGPAPSSGGPAPPEPPPFDRQGGSVS